MSIEKVGVAKGDKVILRACSQAGRKRPQWLALGGGGSFGGGCRGTRRSRRSMWLGGGEERHCIVWLYGGHKHSNELLQAL